jgi:hypothetical protein
MESAESSKMLISIYQTTRRHILENRYLTRHCILKNFRKAVLGRRLEYILGLVYCIVLDEVGAVLSLTKIKRAQLLVLTIKSDLSNKH